MIKLFINQEKTRRNKKKKEHIEAPKIVETKPEAVIEQKKEEPIKQAVVETPKAPAQPASTASESKTTKTNKNKEEKKPEKQSEKVQEQPKQATAANKNQKGKGKNKPPQQQGILYHFDLKNKYNSLIII